MLEKIRVASLANDMGIGGTARQAVSIDKHLNKEFFEHFIISLSSQGDTRSKFVDSKKVFFISDPKEIADVLEKNKVNILYVHRHGRNDPRHDAIAKEVSSDVEIAEMNTFSVEDKGYFGQRCNKHIFVSQTNVVKYCAQNNINFDFKKHKVLYGLVDSENFISKSPTESEIKEYKNKFGISGHPVMGRLARPVMEKWDDQMLVMWKKLSQINPQTKFVIYGVPEEKKKLLQSAGNLENLIMLDPTDSDKELALFYSAIDVFVHDSQIGECNCGAIAEAMLFKKPCVIMSTPFPKYIYGRNHTNDNGQIEQIKNGENGYVVTSGTAMAYAVDSLFKNPDLAKKMGERNGKELLDRYDVSVGIKTLEKIFMEIMLDRGISLPESALNYYNSFKFYPDENEVKNWFKEYYFRLDDVYGKEYSNSALDKAILFYLKYHRKFKTVLKKLGI
ncbi:MAG: hypothetical protein A2534_04985 [Candidatus Magasanikbacteria bacterium RIFOXYD2_FULL_39_9]|uniref:Glycosyl transferase family 1 domain-containing protein n=1 Tax=Candidatus Magasanikbacteria bacterium RIFOXYD1_FULL_40_23 TaxID=1798705 RepID=A0A1F6P9K1_9BACT|nr:MAG: hypothetical protein A2534_04985 [Candidatus Magasanikbacteria bacterium RIFOXYD2_FULL_39_9]OGH92857.1 MAG: hypothetical protein A2563_04290 [Candidatus Magasanikbacteria bacterium RIFOXYD1_FULL_40_23]